MKKETKELLLVLGIVGIVMAACIVYLILDDSPPPVDTSPRVNGVLEELHVYGQHELVKQKDLGNLQNFSLKQQIDGGIFFSTGKLEINGSSVPSVAFKWKWYDGKELYTTVPLAKIVTIVDESKQVPTIQFVFDDYYPWYPVDFGEYVPTGKPHDSKIKKNQLAVNVNPVLEGNEHITAINVYISSADKAKEIYLP